MKIFRLIRIIGIFYFSLQFSVVFLIREAMKMAIQQQLSTSFLIAVENLQRLVLQTLVISLMAISVILIVSFLFLVIRSEIPWKNSES